jgi:AraC-like DNA-binding protein
MKKLMILSVCILGLSGMIFHHDQAQDMSVEDLLNNLRSGRFSGKPIDLHLEGTNIAALFSRLEKSTGISFKLDPRIPQQFPTKKVYSFKHVRWDQILSLVLKDLNLEAMPTDEGISIQPLEGDRMRIVREADFREPVFRRIHPLLYLLAVSVLAGVISGLMLYRKKLKAGPPSSGGFVIDPAKADEIMKKVIYKFDVEKIYKKDHLSLAALSEELAIPSYQLSWIINKKMNKTFSGLVNSYRVREVRKRLTSPSDADKNILEIAFDAGFNTKTSFNRVFKKLTRTTPSQYRQQHRQKKSPGS